MIWNFKRVGICTIVLFCIAGCSNEHTINWNNVEPSGTEPRVEREYKYVFDKAPSLDVLSMGEVLHAALNKKIEEGNIWKSEAEVQSSLYADPAVKLFFYRDIYADTAEYDLYNADIQYRMRHRFKSREIYDLHQQNVQSPKYAPYRMEFQTKTDRSFLENGFSEATESRFEFREESHPFSKDNPPPKKPWEIQKYMPFFLSGTFEQYFTWPGKALVSTLKTPSGTFPALEPSVVLLSDRARMHLNIKTPWGSGPNPEQAFIITLDKTTVYPTSYVDFFMGKGSFPNPTGSFWEVEVEFERNTSEKLDEAIAEAVGEEKERLEKIRSAFLQDQNTIMQAIQKELLEQSIALQPSQKSKYKTAIDILRGAKNVEE